MYKHIYLFLIRETQQLYKELNKKIIFIFDNFSPHIDDDCLEMLQDTGNLLFLSIIIQLRYGLSITAT